MENVRVRFAPSPTGYLHIGSLRTALFNWLWAKKNNGQFILRIEDTDQQRYVEGAVENIKEALDWYGLDIDEGPFFQSKRLDIYKKHVEKLLADETAYYCFCSAERLDEVRKIQKANKEATKYDGLCRSLTKEEIKKRLARGEEFVVRLKVPHQGETIFDDKIYGQIKVQNANVDDQVLMKSDGFPTYHLANVVDDHEMKISHVIRGDEWMPSTPKHVILYQAFGWEPPVFAHLPLILGPDKAKLSKRHGAKPALEYRESGYLPEAVLNFIALLGWNPKTAQEIFTIKELIKEFDLNKINKSSAVFNKEKLDWMNKQYLLQKGPDLEKVMQDYYKKLTGKMWPIKGARSDKVISVSAQRIVNLNEILSVVNNYITDFIPYSSSILIPKGETLENTLAALLLAQKELEKISETNFKEDFIKTKIVDMIKNNNLTNKIVLWPLRVALTGKEKSEDVFEALEGQGKQRSLRFLNDAIFNLQKR